MQTKNLKRKGFTLVELVVVVAVIAVLSAILIPTIGCFVEQAKETNDMATVRLLNVALVEDGAEHSAPKTMDDVVKVMEEKGYGIEKLTPRSSGDILWDSVNNRFLLRREKDSENLYYDNSKTLSENHLLWRVAKNQDDIKSEYSNYLKDGGTFNADQPITTGLDVGKHIGINVTYTGEKYALIRTNGGKLTVNAPNAHVEHYNLATEVDLQKVSASTYVEHGIVGKMTVAAEAKNVVIKATAVVPEINNSSVNLNLETGAVVNTVNGTNPKTGTASGESGVIKVSSYEQLQGLALASTAGVQTLNNIELLNDIDLSGKSWQPFGFDEQHPFEGTIDGKGHTIKGLCPNGYSSTAIIVNTTNKNTGVAYGFVSVAKNATIKNVNFTDVNINIENGIAIGAVVGDARGNSLTIENVTVSGAVKGRDKVGGLVGLAGYNDSSAFQLTINNCTNNASVTAVCNDRYNRAGGIVGALGGDAKFTGKTVIITNCTNNGAVTSKGAQVADPSNPGAVIRAGGLIGQTNGSNGKTFNVTGSVNSGKITAENTATSTTLVLGENEDNNINADKFVGVSKLYYNVGNAA